MVILKRNLYRNHRCHFSPGNRPPPSTHVSAKSYADSYPEIKYQTVRAAHKHQTPPFPLTRGIFAMAPYTEGGYDFPETFVMQLPRGRVLHSEGIILTHDNRLVTETASNFHRQVEDHRIFQHLSLPSVSFVGGRVAVLASLHADVYFHWMCNVLPRLGLLHRLSVEYDWLYLPALTQPFQVETLRWLNVDLNRVFVGGRGLHLEAETLVVPSLPSHPCDYPPQVADFLRAAIPTTPRSGPKRRLYLSRAGALTRQVLNEPQLLPLLAKRGFESILLESLTVREQAHLFSEAEAILSPHGAALTNLAFCQPGTQLIELFHPLHICDCYWQVSHHLGVQHAVILAQRGFRNVAKRFNDRNHDMVLSPKQLLRTLDELGL
jgi:hypothetical protein